MFTDHVICWDVDPQKFKALHPFYLLPSYAEGRVHCEFWFPEVDSFGFWGVELHVVMTAPLQQMLDFLPVGCFIVDAYHSFYGGVIGKLDNGFRGMDGGAVMCKESTNEGLRTYPCGAPVLRIL